MSTETSAPADWLPAFVRVLTAAVFGSLAGAAAALTGLGAFAPLLGWDSGAVLFLVWTWCAIGPMNPADTASHATREEPSRPVAHVLVLVAAVASLGAVVTLLLATRTRDPDVRFLSAGVGLASVFLSWAVVHTLYTLRYAHLYYSDEPGGIEFNQHDGPRYADFAYLSFTLGMTYQVSDTDIGDPRIRVTALWQSLLSYLFGAIILAGTINLVVALGS